MSTAVAADSSAATVRAGQFWDCHVALLEACGGAIDVLSLAGVSIEERLGNVPRWFREVVCHARGAMLALAAATLWSNEDLHYMAIGFLPVDRPNDVSVLAMEFTGAAGAIAKYERVEDVIQSAPHDV
jgi:hypothetical protein